MRNPLVAHFHAADAGKEGAMNYGQRRNKRSKRESEQRRSRRMYMFLDSLSREPLAKYHASGRAVQDATIADARAFKRNRGLAKKGKSE